MNLRSKLEINLNVFGDELYDSKGEKGILMIC